MTKPCIPVICGPTASGKTAVAVQLSRRIVGEVVSCDSMQVYRGMDIGTAKPTEEERQGIPHHMIDIVDPKESYTVSVFGESAKRVIADIAGRGACPVLCGGTGLYIDAILKPMGFSEKSDEQLRQALRDRAQAPGGREALFEELRQIDSDSAARLHPNDVRRVVRAIEVFRLTGLTLTEQMRIDQQREKPYDALAFALEWPRDALYRRIDDRVDQMIGSGLKEEVERLLDQGVPDDATSMQGLGYKEMVAYLTGRCGLDDAIAAIKLGSRHYAKRQITWFRRDQSIQWIAADQRSADSLAEQIAEAYRKHEQDRSENRSTDGIG